MSLKYNSRLLRIAGLLLCVLVWLANNGNPPTGRSGAPFDGHCNGCHDGNNPGGFNGSVTVAGLPNPVEANTTYPLTITMTPTAGTPIRGGYQMVVVDGTNANAGNLTATNGQSGTEFFNGREYIEHRGSKNFNGNPVSWDFEWTSPAVAAGNSIRLYFIGNFTNGNNNDSGDFPTASSAFYSFNGPPPVSVSISNTVDVSCFGGADGSATASPSGGAPPYTYSWSNGQNGQTAVNLSAGAYTVTVTGAGGSGSATATAFITQAPVLNLSASVAGILTCINTTVTATAMGSGGAGGFSYNWSNGDTGSQTEFSTPGSHSVTLTDANGCTEVAFVTVNSNQVPPNVDAGPVGVITCLETTLTLDGSGSSQGPTFTYLWTASNGGNILAGANSINPIVDAAGTYTLVVTNSNNGCTSSDFTTVDSDTDPPSATTMGDTLTCDVNTVVLSVMTNASQPEFSWAGPNSFSSNEQNPEVDTVGDYTVTVTDGLTGCTNTAVATVAENTIAPTATAVGDTLTCAANMVSLEASSNAMGATYSWTGPNNFNSNEQNPSVGTPGSYAVVVTDTTNGCTNSATAMVGQNITAPSATVSAEEITCADTLAQLTAMTNADSATYSWTGPGGFTSMEQNPEVSEVGPYTLVITDTDNGCTSTATATVNENITPPTASAMVPGTLNCNTSSLELNGTGSSQGPTYTYLWTTADGNITAGDTTLTPTVDAAGEYTLQVTNSANGCISTTSVTVVESPPVTTTTTIIMNASCNGASDASATASGGGGSGNYSYLWSNGINTDTIENLTAGTYVVTVTDTENCTSTAAVTISEPNILTPNATATGETSLGGSDGTATAIPTGGTPDYAYLWNTSDTTAMITGLAPGSYSVTVTDNNNCTAVQTVTVNSFNCAISVSATLTNESCNGASDGMATANVSGGAMPIIYLWSTGDTTATAADLSPGTYTVQVTDANNCPAEISVQITGPAVLLANASATNQSGLGLNDGTASAQPTGGTVPYAFLWSNDSTTQTIVDLAPGIYTVTVTDNNSCVSEQTVTVGAFNCNLTSTITASNVSCAGGADGQATAVSANGAAPIIYLWSNGDTTATTTNLTPGTYTVTITDSDGCETNTAASISEPPPLEAMIESVIPSSCPESLDGSAVVSAQGGTAPYSFVWPNGSGGQGLGVGAYTVTLTDANNCTTTQIANIVSNDTIAPTIACLSAPIILCFGETVTLSDPIVSDNCNLNGAQAVLISGLPSGSTYPVGETVQEYQITDASGNTATCSYIIKVEPPIEVFLDGFSPDVNNSGIGSIDISASGGGGGLIYAWEKDGQFFSNAEDLSGLTVGTYVLTVTDVNGCVTMLTPVVIDNTVGTNELDGLTMPRIIPNPVRQTFRLEMNDISPIAMQIFDVQGRMIRNLKPTEWETEIDVENLAPGLHYLLVRDKNDQSFLIKWMKVE